MSDLKEIHWMAEIPDPKIKKNVNTQPHSLKC